MYYLIKIKSNKMNTEEVNSLILQREIRQPESNEEKFEPENQKKYKREIPLTLEEKEKLSSSIFKMVTEASERLDIENLILPI